MVLNVINSFTERLVYEEHPTRVDISERKGIRKDDDKDGKMNR